MGVSPAPEVRHGGGPEAKCYFQDEARLANIQGDVLKGPTDVPGGKALHASQRLGQSLEQLWLRLNRQQHMGRLLTAAAQLHLHRTQLPLPILQV